jgi:hypothetical protein
MPHQACRRAVVTIFLISILFIALLPSPAGAQVPPSISFWTSTGTFNEQILA